MITNTGPEICELNTKHLVIIQFVLLTCAHHLNPAMMSFCYKDRTELKS